MEVIVPDDQLSLAIGKRGQNVRLAAKLTGWKIDRTESKSSGRKASLRMRCCAKRWRPPMKGRGPPRSG